MSGPALRLEPVPPGPGAALDDADARLAESVVPDKAELERELGALTEEHRGVIRALFYEGRAISFELPTTIVREVIYTEPAVRGDTSGKVLKPAKLATGFEVQVPAFCATGDKIEIDTRTHEYKRRVNA